MKYLPDGTVATDNNSTYIGDGAYVTSTDRNDLIIWTDRGPEGLHWVAIELRDIPGLLRAINTRATDV